MPKRAIVAIALVGAIVAVPKDAHACGACYASASESTVVNDHKMALAISKQQTILWDQISYSGSPTEFAYVVPARPGTRVEPSADAWFNALDLSTRPILMAPQGFGGGGGDDGLSCGCSDSEDSASGASGGASRESVTVVDRKVVGPYETVTLRSTDPQALEAWLRKNGFAIPDSSGPIIAAYVVQGFDFIALRLRPGQDVRSIEPIRIVAPGPDATLPLRMMQIGAGAKLGITLWVIGEGRWHPANFPDATIDFEKLVWDGTKNRSNYQELSIAAMAENGGRSFLTEYSDRPNLDAAAPRPAAGQMSNVGLATAYASACRPAATPPRPTPAPLDASTDASADGGDDDGGAADAAADAGLAVEVSTCDDLKVALDGLNGTDVRVTRLRADLPFAALADTLVLEPTSQERVDNVHYAKTSGTITARVSRPSPGARHGTYAMIAGTIFLVSRLLRRRRRSR